MPSKPKRDFIAGINPETLLASHSCCLSRSSHVDGWSGFPLRHANELFSLYSAIQTRAFLAPRRSYRPLRG